LYFVDLDSAVEKAAKIMKEESVGSVIVLDGAKAVGILTQRDLINKIFAEGKNLSAVKVSEAMSSPLITIKKDETVEKALFLMEKNNIRRIVVLDDKGKPYGISVEIRICGDLLDEQVRKKEIKAKSWLDEHIMEVTESELAAKKCDIDANNFEDES
jgi:predicted transcriptional regulator